MAAAFGIRRSEWDPAILLGRRFDLDNEMRRFDEIRNCTNLGILMGEIERIAVTHRHWDHMAGLPAAIDAIVGQGGRVSVHVDPDMFNERALRLKSGTVIPVANVPSPAELERHGAIVVNNPDERLLLDRHFYYSGEIPGSASNDGCGRAIIEPQHVD